MKIVCLDLEGVLIPEIWIAFAEAQGIPELKRTTRDEPDYDKLMRFRLALLERHGLRLGDIQRVIGHLEPLEGAVEFTRSLRERTELILLSDTFEQFAQPLMAKLGYPTLLCNSLVIGPVGEILGYQLRQHEGKKRAVAALKSLNLEVFAGGDSFNDLAMIREAEAGCLFRPPPKIREDCRDIPIVESYAALLAQIEEFLSGMPR